jgi:hypothetical protein
MDSYAENMLHDIEKQNSGWALTKQWRADITENDN